MIETGLLIYLYTVCLALADFFKSFIPILIIVSPLIFGLLASTSEDLFGFDTKTFIKRSRKFLKPLLIFICVGTSIPLIVPDKQDIKWIIGGTLAVEAAKGATKLEGIERLPQNLVDAMNAFLEQVSEPEVLKNELD